MNPASPPTDRNENLAGIEENVPLEVEGVNCSQFSLLRNRTEHLKWFFPCNDIEVDYESNENASIVYAALAIDKELQPDKVKRQISVIDRKLLVYFDAFEARFLRASFSAFAVALTLANKNNQTVWSRNGIVKSYYLWQLENHSY